MFIKILLISIPAIIVISLITLIVVNNKKYNNFVEGHSVAYKFLLQIIKRDGNKCAYCGSTINFEINHIIIIAKGGKTTYDNIQTFYHRYNKIKSDN